MLDHFENPKYDRSIMVYGWKQYKSDRNTYILHGVGEIVFETNTFGDPGWFVYPEGESIPTEDSPFPSLDRAMKSTEGWL